MTAAAKRSHDTQLSELDVSREEFDNVRTRFKEMSRKLAQLRLARDLAQLPHDIPLPRAAKAVEQAGAELENAKRNPRRTDLRIEELHDDLDAVRRDYDAAKIRYEAAANADAIRLAEEFRPRHKTAVQAVALALESLSAALADETAVRDEFDRTAPTVGPTSYLPNMSAALMRFGWLPNRDSTAAAWGREARAKGLVE